MTTLHFLIDVDNTLINNDLIKHEIDMSLEKTFGLKEQQHFWKHYENYRDESGLIDFYKIIKEYCHIKDPDNCDLNVHKIIEGIEFKSCKYNHVDNVLNHLRSFSKVYLFTEGDLIYQKVKIEGAGLNNLVDKTYLYKHKTQHLHEILKDVGVGRKVFIEDKIKILKSIKEEFLNEDLLLIHVEQGRYAEIDKEYSEIDIRIKKIGDLLKFSRDDFEKNS